ncbi:ferric reductase like transmembrane component-domain-containing protein [Gamsiella multidivaricata]|uniref:ferric reductase like transmembrane component-domain-containing protein n=1 Tax=Gamsiella multidivaricata TaxID=101098 RepID=UPI00221F08EE|nr:ferric reductase like transmembrane component-domain-containing protein [Gamsiella multidivaricata]KAI7832325.1 ferric reductase like transmembrane component-domain-containing protein [Gamsiella multidivaricata]
MGLSIDPLRALVLLCLLIITGYMAVEGYYTWVLYSEWIFDLNNRDYLTVPFMIFPSVLGHMATIWGHYYRAEREFQHSIAKVTTPVSVKQKISLWEHHVLWGYTVKFWILAGFMVLLNIGWSITAIVPYAKDDYAEYGPVGGLGLVIGLVGGYNAIACCTFILFLVLRRSMLHSLGFTYAEILPLHRWLGVGILVWSIIHTIGYVMYYIWDKSLGEAISFDDIGRATMNLMGVIALIALLVLAFFSIPQIRRRFYTAFIGVHRVMTVIFLIGTITHYPYFMLWYYLLPSVILFLVDRFVPKMIQSRTLYPEASCTLNVDADIIKLTLTSPEPMKPYYPGDYISVQVPELGTLYHPFTIASYWPEDPRSIVLFIRTYHTPKSWTGALSRLCGTEDKRIRVKANVEGVFGDRRHDYLKSEVLVVFVAGAAVTTFMALIKAIAAQIASSTDPLRMQFHLICTFRTRSELHAYGSFLHQITRDPRFTSWLHVEIYVSRPDKPNVLMGAHAHVIKNDILVPAQSATKSKKKRFQSLRRTGTKLKRALSGRTIVETSANDERMKSKAESEAAGVSFSAAGGHVRSGSVDTAVENEKQEGSRRASSSSSPATQSFDGHSSVDHSTCPSPVASPSSPISPESRKSVHDEIDAHDHSTALTPSSPTRATSYDAKRLPTFHDANSNTVSARFAKLDFTVSAVLILVPLAVWLALRAIHYEGSAHYCDIMTDMTPTQYKICYGSYSSVPVFGHYIIASIIGYLAMHYARKTLLRSLTASNLSDIETGKSHNKNLPYPTFEIEDENLSVEDGNWDEGDVVYSTGRMNVKIVIERFMGAGVGAVGSDRAMVAVFGGGPEAFVEHVERQIKKSKWAVDFHRETWAP